MFHKIFLWPQVKRRMVISNKNGISKLPQELPNQVRLGILEKLGYTGKSQNFI